MDWHCWTVLLVIVSAVASHENAAASEKIQEKRLSFDQHSKCTYSYELALHEDPSLRQLTVLKSMLW